MINTKWLRSFCTLVDTGHFTRTAEQLYMTQSGVSQHIQKLEEQLGLPLLIRQGKRFTLTDAGERLYEEAQSIVSALENLEQRVSNDPAFEGVVRVMSPGSIGLKLYPHLLELQRKHSALSIDYRFAPNNDIEQAIAENRIDFGLMTSAPSDQQISYQPIAEESLLLVTPASVKEPTWQALETLGFIDHPDGSHHARLLLGANFPEFQHSNLFIQKGFSNQISLILNPVSMGLGFSVLPAHAVAAFTQQQLIKVHQLLNPVNEPIYLGLPRNKPMPNRVNSVISEVKKRL